MSEFDPSEMLRTVAGLVTIAGLTSLLLGALSTFVLAIRRAAETERQVRARVVAAETQVEKEPERAKPAWDLARATLDAYFNRNLVS